MAIRLSHNCLNCEYVTDDDFCGKHKVDVSPQHTCDSFSMKAKLKNENNCGNCAKFKQESCANPKKAAIGMLCSSWAPQEASA
jgi:hypothetical protein